MAQLRSLLTIRCPARTWTGADRLPRFWPYLALAYFDGPVNAIVTPTPTQEMGRPGLCPSEWTVPGSAVNPSTKPSWVSDAWSATTPPPNSGRSSSGPAPDAVSRKYPKTVGHSEAGPHFAYDGERGMFNSAEADPQVRKEHDEQCLRS